MLSQSSLTSFSATATRRLLAGLFLCLLCRFFLGSLLGGLAGGLLLSCLLRSLLLRGLFRCCFLRRRFLRGRFLRRSLFCGRFRRAPTAASDRRGWRRHRRFRSHFGIAYTWQFCFLFFLFFFVIFFQRFAIGAAVAKLIHFVVS